MGPGGVNEGVERNRLGGISPTDATPCLQQGCISQFKTIRIDLDVPTGSPSARPAALPETVAIACLGMPAIGKDAPVIFTCPGVEIWIAPPPPPP